MGDAHMRPEDAEVSFTGGASQPRTGAGRRHGTRSAHAGHAPRTRGARLFRRLPQQYPAGACRRPGPATRGAPAVRGHSRRYAGAESGSRPRRDAAFPQRDRAVCRSDGRRRRALYRRRFACVSEGGGWIGGLDLSLRAGFGLDGVTGPTGDGLVYADLGLHADSPSTNHYSESYDATLLEQPERRHSRALEPVRSCAHAVLRRAVRPVAVVAALSRRTGYVQKHLRGRR